MCNYLLCRSLCWKKASLKYIVYLLTYFELPCFFFLTPLLPPRCPHLNPPTPHLKTTKDQGRRELRKTRVREASGPDTLSSRLLREGVDQLREVVQSMFNLSLTLDTVPVLGKTSGVVPVTKVSPPSELDHYRPVVLTSPLMESLERILLSHLPRLDPLQSTSLWDWWRSSSSEQDFIINIILA